MLGCSRRFTTYERATEVVVVVKRSGQREPFERRKVIGGVRAACKNRPVPPEAIEALASEVEEVALLSRPPDRERTARPCRARAAAGAR